MSYSDPVNEVREDGYATPEEAALAGWDTRYARVHEVSYAANGKEARVTLLTNEEPYLYPYYVWCERDSDGRWSESHSSN